ncbi:Caspase-3 [Culex quinquefasciatus]|uniref:Caspase-3 n=1 Tax=Culex quinquefasciatus TaxID=7176 RepID=B0WZJ3_CULQU|nr:Caspase-3 [Culex quinquefasciatus]|eukprot:XP_001862815.1 Caspase-3 [Culex quinquefasciatus]
MKKRTISFRDSERGTYFIQILLSLIKENEDKDLSEIMDLIRRCFYRAKYENN